MARELEKEIILRLNIKRELLSRDERKLLKLAVHEEIREISKRRKENEFQNERNKLLEKMKDSYDLQNIENFFTVSGYAKASGVSFLELKKYFPEIINIIDNRNKNRWSIKYEKCKACGTVLIPHKSKGYCEQCYYKSDYFKLLNKESYLRHLNKRKEKLKEYLVNYNKRPEVKERKQKKYDEIKYGGNRLLALERDHFRCTGCNITQENSLKKYEKSLYVEHIEKGDNNLNNLLTLCYSCHQKWVLRRARQAKTSC